MFCREHVVQLHHHIDAIHAAGAELVVIGSGKPHFVAGFRELTGYKGPLYVDPELKSYEAAGLERGMWRNFTPLSFGHAVRALARGNMQGRTQGDPSQQGGAMVIAPGGKLLFAHVSKVAGDNASPEVLLGALRAGSAATATRP
jgi:hypothetical protein